MNSTHKTVGVAMVGHAFMGRAHGFAWSRLAQTYGDLELRPRLAVLVGTNPKATEDDARRLGFETWTTDWREAVTRQDVDLVDICSPGSNHAPVALAALEAGKHVLCEKPLANTVQEAEAMAEAARRAKNVIAMVSFNNRRVAAIALARRLIEEGRLGRIRHFRAVYLQDWLVDPSFPLLWRMRREEAGSGAVGDLGAHIVDLAQYLVDDWLEEVVSVEETFIKHRPLPNRPEETGEVTVDDAAAFLGRFSGGALATFETTRFATGRRNHMSFEVNGELGSLWFNLEQLNELWFYESNQAEAGFRRILVTEANHPYLKPWWPPGHVLGWEHSFVHQAYDLLKAIEEGSRPRPDFDEGLQVQRVLEAAQLSARQHTWIRIELPGAQRA
jgi:predicted dehydrogenase